MNVSRQNFTFITSNGKNLSFSVTNVSDQDINNLRSALFFLEKSATAEIILDDMATKVATPKKNLYPFVFNIIHNGKDAYGNNSNTLDWDPAAADIVYSGTYLNPGQAIGVDSAALGLIHEMAHLTDPNVDDAPTASTDPVNFPNAYEQYAVGKEDAVANDLGEIQRTSWLGYKDEDSNPTDHTVPNKLTWQEQILNGEVTITGGSFTTGRAYSSGSFNYPGNPAIVQGHSITINKATIDIAANDVLVIGSGNTINLRNGLTVKNSGTNEFNTVVDPITITGNAIVSSDANGNLSAYFDNSDSSSSIDYILPNSGSSVVTIDGTAAEASALVYVEDTQLTGGVADGVSSQWSGSDGTLYTFVPAPAGDFGYGQLDITVSQSLSNANSGDQIIIQNFDINQTQSANGYMGIHFNEQVAMAVGNKPHTIAEILNAQTSSALDPPPGAYTFTAYVSALSDQPQQVTINMTQGDANGFEVDTGNGLIPFSNGTVTLTIAPGQDSVTFGLVNIKPVTQAARASSQKGDLISVGSGNNTIFSSTANEAIFMGSGNNLVVLCAGNDTVYGGDTVIHISQISCQWAASLGC